MGANGAIWQIRLNRRCAAAMRPFYQIILTIVIVSYISPV